jgi:hypothetical protein
MERSYARRRESRRITSESGFKQPYGPRGSRRMKRPETVGELASEASAFQAAMHKKHFSKSD